MWLTLLSQKSREGERKLECKGKRGIIDLAFSREGDHEYMLLDTDVIAGFSETR